MQLCAPRLAIRTRARSCGRLPFDRSSAAQTHNLAEAKLDSERRQEWPAEFSFPWRQPSLRIAGDTATAIRCTGVAEKRARRLWDRVPRFGRRRERGRDPQSQPTTRDYG